MSVNIIGYCMSTFLKIKKHCGSIGLGNNKLEIISGGIGICR